MKGDKETNRETGIMVIVITGIRIETGREENATAIVTRVGKEVNVMVIVTRIGITEDRTREVTGITIVFPIVENVVKGGLKIGMKT